MKTTITQKVIKIGDSAGVTLPAKLLKQLSIAPGSLVDITVREHKSDATDSEVLAAAKDVLARYEQDFKNLAGR